MPLGKGQTNRGSFQKGKSGNPGGRPAAMLTPILREIMEANANGEISKAKRLAEVLIDKALDGDMDAIKMLFDRVDGKVALPIEGTDNPLKFEQSNVVIYLPELDPDPDIYLPDNGRGNDGGQG